MNTPSSNTTVLTAEQREAVESIASRQLVVAAAGSGKTATMVAKVLYAIQQRGVAANQILVLAFNTRAAQELGERIADALHATAPDMVLQPDKGVTSSTLHALGLSIVRQATTRPLQVITTTASSTSETAHQQGLLLKVLQELLQQNSIFIDRWLLFRRHYALTLALPHDMTSRFRWRRFLQRHAHRKDGHRGFMCLQGGLFPSQFEQSVADWLLLQGIAYRFGPLRQTANPLSRWWLKHSGVLLGKQGFVLEQGEQIICVRSKPGTIDASRNCDSAVRIILPLDTYYDGSWVVCLRTALADYDFSRTAQRLPPLLSAFGQPMVAAQWQFLQRVIHTPLEAGRYAEFFAMHRPMFAHLASAYKRSLQNQGCIDFDMMLEQATTLLQQGEVRHSFAMVLVDEFQDTSLAGLKLLQALLQQQPATELFAVGDDWQSIYGFAGALPEVMQQFSDYFGPAKVSQLTATFRFNQTIADAASHFVQQNPRQLPKVVRAMAAPYPDAIQIAYYAQRHAMYSLCATCLQEIARKTDTQKPLNQLPTVLILGRYQHLHPVALTEWQQAFPRLQITFLTIHAAKGLEADYVIILGLGCGRYGLPSGVTADPWHQALNGQANDYPHAEERRVFYVALTRAKKQVICLVDKTRPSPFMEDLPAASLSYRQ